MLLNNNRKKDYSKGQFWVGVITVIFSLIALLLGDGLLMRHISDEKPITNSNFDMQDDKFIAEKNLATYEKTDFDALESLEVIPDIVVPLSADISNYNNMIHFIPTFNASEIILHVFERSLLMEWGGAGKAELGDVNYTYPEYVTVYLLNYDNYQIVDSQTSYLGSAFNFNNIPDGTYFFVVECDGYDSDVSDNPFTIKFDPNEEEAVLPWAIYLEKNSSSYGQAFYVKMVDSAGHVVKNVDTYVRVVQENETSPKCYCSYPVHTKENGLLAVWYGRNEMYHYNATSFMVKNGFRVQVQNHNGQFVNVSFVSSNRGVVVY